MAETQVSALAETRQGRTVEVSPESDLDFVCQNQAGIVRRLFSEIDETLTF
jgi:hypothetical protein